MPLPSQVKRAPHKLIQDPTFRLPYPVSLVRLLYSASPPPLRILSTALGSSPVTRPAKQANAMASHHRRHLPSYLALLLSFLLPTLAASLWPSCGNNGNFTANSTYQANIKALSVTLPKNASSSRTLFALGSFGTLPDIVYALALCRGDANASGCSDCVSKGFDEAQQLCPYNRDATVYDDPCYLRFSNQNFLSATGGDNTALILSNTQNVTAPVKVFDAAVGALINATADYAAENSSRRFATGEEGFETVDKGNPKIYGLAQCRPDMAPADCRSCLAGIITYIPRYFSGKQGGRILGLQCNYRYEQYPFYTGPSLLQLPAPSLGVAPSPAPVNATPISPPPPGRGEPREKLHFISTIRSIRPEVIPQFSSELRSVRKRKRRNSRWTGSDYSIRF